MILLCIASLGPGGKEKRFLQLEEYLSTESIITKRFVFYESLALNIGVVGKLRRVIALYKLLFAMRPKAIHSWSSFITLLSFPYALIFRVKLVDSSISTNGLDGGFLFKLIRRLAMIVANEVTCNSYRAVQNLGMRSKVKVIRNGIDKIEGSVMKDSSEHKTIWFVARLEPGKRVDLFLEVATKLNRSNKSLKFKVVGKGSLFAQYVRDNKFSDIIEFTGYDSKFMDKLSIGDIGVLITDSEGTPNVLLEYMSKGIPVVYWNLDSFIDSPVANGLTGYNSNNIEDFVSKIEKLLLDRSHYKNLSDNALDHIKTNYNLSRNFSAFKRIY